MKPRERKRNAGHSRRKVSRATRRQPPPSPYILKDGSFAARVSSITSLVNTSFTLREVLGQLIPVADYRDPKYFAMGGIVGTCVHTGIESHLRDDVPSIDPLACGATAAMQLHTANADGLLKPSEIEHNSNRAAWSLANWIRWSQAQAFSPLAIEKPVIDEHLRVGGTMDLVEQAEDGLRVRDWKSSAYTSVDRIGGLMPKYAMQMGAYAGLVSRAYKRPVKHAQLVFCPKVEGAEVFTVDFDEDELKRQWRMFRAALHIYHGLKEGKQ